MIWEPGQKLCGGSFEIIKPLGEGGYSITYLAREILYDKQVVIKIPRKTFFPNYDEQKYLRQFWSEARTLAKVAKNSPHIVNVRTFFEELIKEKGIVPCIVMDFIEGETLMKRVQDNGFLPEEESLKYIRQVGKALVEVHKQNIVHQDANPKNIMIQSDGNAVLIDFGIAKSMTPSANTIEYGITEHFAPYEQCRPKKGDKRLPTSDIYSLAATFYYAVTGEFPTKATERDDEVKKTTERDDEVKKTTERGDEVKKTTERDDEVKKTGIDPLRSPKQINSKLSKHINDAILLGMALDKKDRPQSMEEWLQKLKKPIAHKQENPIAPILELKKINYETSYSPIRTSYVPLLPKMKMKSDWFGGYAAGQWSVEGIPLLKKVADNLDIDTSKMREIDSIPSPWSKSLQFLSAILNFNHPSRDWLIAQYRGFLAAIALSENLGLSLQATRVNLQDYLNTDFGRCLWNLLPSAQYSILSSVSKNNPWSELFLFELEENVIGLTSPATLVAPVSNLKPEVERRIPWVKNGFFTNPIVNGLSPLHKEILAAWLYNLRNQVSEQLLKEPVNQYLAESIAQEIEKFYQDLGIDKLHFFEASEHSLLFGEPLTPKPLDALISMKKIKQPSNVEVLYSPTLTPKTKLYLIDIDIKIPAITGWDALSINVIDSFSLAHFDRNLHSYQYRDSVFLTPSELFSGELFYAKTKGLLPGTWLDRKLNLDDLSVLLPLNPILKEYFSSEDLEKSIQLASCNTPTGEGIRVTLGLKLSGFEKPIQYQVYKDFPLKAINEITQSFPILALWPNVPPDKWREYFVFVELTEAFGGVAFSIEQPTEMATQEISQSGQEKYLYWKCDRHPEILSAISQDGKFLGLLPLNIPKIQADSASTWTVGVEVEASFTNVHIRKDNYLPIRFNLQSNLLHITRQLEEIESVVYREFFIPEGNNLPLQTILTTRGWNETIEQIPSVISQARIYQPSLDQNYSNEDYIKTNIKLQQVEYLRPFLGQLLRLIAAQANLESIDSIRWIFSYPLNFSQGGLARYTATWEVLLEELRKISGQSHELDDQALRPNNVAMAQFFGDILAYDLVHTTCINFSKNASEVSIWQENSLVYQSSISYGVRDFFHRILKPNLAFIGDIFCLPFQYRKSLRRKFAKAENVNSALDHYLRINEKEILLDNYITGSDNYRNREFRTLFAFSLGGFYHYLGLVQKYLNQENLTRREELTRILIGGNCSHFLNWLNWLSPSGRYTSDSEVNTLLQGILTQASGLRENPCGITYCNYGDEVSCGLVVLPDGEKLTGLRENDNHLFLGEDCRINGQFFTADQQLKLGEDWKNIEDFEITSFSELEKYISNFNSIIGNEDILEIGSLRNFVNGKLLNITDDLQKHLQALVANACLRKLGPISEFEPEPPFLLTLRCFIDILAEEWSRS